MTVIAPSMPAFTSAARAQSDQRAGVIVSWASVIFILALPFASMDLPIPLGAFNTNLSLLPLFVLMPAAISSFISSRVTGGDAGLSAGYLHWWSWFLIWCAGTTLITGFWFELDGLTAYGATPLWHSLARVPVPLFLMATIYVSYLVARDWLSNRAFERTVVVGAAMVALYGLFQALSARLPNGLYEAVASVVETGRPRNSGYFVPYVELHGQLNLMTLEPAEASRLLLIFFLPVLVTLRDARRRWSIYALVAALLAILFLTGSLVGQVGLVAFVFLWVVTERSLAGFAGLAFLLALGPLVLMALPSELVTGILYSITEKPFTLSDPSTQTRAAFAVAAFRTIAEHPLIGIGWSKDIFFLPARMPSWGFNAEVMQSLTTGDNIAPKSLLLRLALYAGPFATVLLCLRTVGFMRRAIERLRLSRDARWRRAFLTVALFAITGLIDGGIITSIYPWAALGFVLGGAARSEAEEARLSPDHAAD